MAETYPEADASRTTCNEVFENEEHSESDGSDETVLYNGDDEASITTSASTRETTKSYVDTQIELGKLTLQKGTAKLSHNPLIWNLGNPRQRHLWAIFGRIFDDDGKFLPDVVGCAGCSAVLPYRVGYSQDACFLISHKCILTDLFAEVKKSKAFDNGGSEEPSAAWPKQNIEKTEDTIRLSCGINFDTEFMQTISGYKLQGKLTDMVLCCEDRIINCHKLVLCSKSQFFEDLILSSKEARPYICLIGLQFWEIGALVEFMYTGHVRVYKEKVMRLLGTANTLQIKGLAYENGSSSTENRNGFNIRSANQKLNSNITKTVHFKNADAEGSFSSTPRNGLLYNNSLQQTSSRQVSNPLFQNVQKNSSFSPRTFNPPPPGFSTPRDQERKKSFDVKQNFTDWRTTNNDFSHMGHQHDSPWSKSQQLVSLPDILKTSREHGQETLSTPWKNDAKRDNSFPYYNGGKIMKEYSLF